MLVRVRTIVLVRVATMLVRMRTIVLVRVVVMLGRVRTVVRVVGVPVQVLTVVLPVLHNS
jgi:hypothetical protein